MKRLFAPFLFLAFSLLVSCSDDDSVDPLGDWVRITPIEGDARSAAVSFVIGNKAYVGTGYDGEDRLADFWEFDPANRSWRQIAPFPGVARNNAVGFSLNGKGYVGTGYNTDFLKDFWEYDPATNTWSEKAPFAGTARQQAVAFALQNKGYVGTGYTDGGKYVNDFWRFDPDDVSNGYNAQGLPLGKWTQVASYSGKNPKRRGAVSFILDGQAYVGLGESSGVYQEDFWTYNPETNQWTEVAELEDYGRAFAGAFVVNGKAYVVGGYNGTAQGNVWEYSPGSDNWTEKKAFEGAKRMYAVGFSVADKGYFGTGSNGSYFDDFWEYSPDVPYDEEN